MSCRRLKRWKHIIWKRDGKWVRLMGLNAVPAGPGRKKRVGDRLKTDDTLNITDISCVPL